MLGITRIINITNNLAIQATEFLLNNIQLNPTN